MTKHARLLFSWEYDAVPFAALPTEKQGKKRFVPLGGKQNPKVLVRGVAMIDAMVVFIWARKNGVAGANGIDLFFHHKGNIAR